MGINALLSSRDALLTVQWLLANQHLLSSIMSYLISSRNLGLVKNRIKLCRQYYMNKYHLTSSSGPVKGNNPFILSRMTVSDDFRRGGAAPAGLVGYDAQGNMISTDPSATITAGYETSSFAMYGSEDAYTHAHTVLPQNIQHFSTNQMIPTAPSIPVTPLMQQAPKSMLTSQMLQQLNHTKSINPHAKKSKKNKTSTPATYIPQVTTPTPPIPVAHVPAYDQITTYSHYSTGASVGGVQNPALMHRNNQLEHYRRIDQTNSGIPTPSESGIPLVPNGDYQRFFTEPKMDNGLWYKHQQQVPPRPMHPTQTQSQTNVGFGTYDKWETGSTLDDAFREPTGSGGWKS